MPPCPAETNILLFILLDILVFRNQVTVLCFDLRPSPKCHSRWCTGRKWHISMTVWRGNRVGGNWLTKWDKLKHPIILSLTDAPEESDLWAAWQLFPLDDDQTTDFKDRVGVELLYSSVKTEFKTVGDGGRRDVVGKATSGRGGPREPRWSLGTKEVSDKMQ